MAWSVCCTTNPRPIKAWPPNEHLRVGLLGGHQEGFLNVDVRGLRKGVDQGPGDVFALQGLDLFATLRKIDVEPPVGVNGARFYNGAADSVGTQLLAQSIVEAHHRELGRVIHRPTCDTRASTDAGDRADHGALAPAQQGYGRPGAKEHTVQVGVDGGAPLLRLALLEHVVISDPGVVEQQVKPSELVFNTPEA